MKKNHFITAVIWVLLFTTCKKEETPATTTPPPPVPTEKILEVKTSFGNMYIWLYKETPLHRANYLGLADTNFFDSTSFHRIVKNWVIQGGDINSKIDDDPYNDGSGSLGYTIPAEFDTSITHVYGAVGAARLGDDVNPEKASDASQFYIVVNATGDHTLDNNYTVFGYVMKGMDVAITIVNQPKISGTSHPLTDIKMDVNILEKTLDEIKAEYNYEPHLQ